MLATIETFLLVQAKQNMSVSCFWPIVCHFATLDLNFTERADPSHSAIKLDNLVLTKKTHRQNHETLTCIARRGCGNIL